MIQEDAILYRPFVVRGIVALNVLVFVAWHFPSLASADFMSRNFLVSGDALVQGRLWTLVSSVFSHFSLLHIFINMFAFYGFGSVLELALGPWRFLRFYLAAGILASVSHAVVSTWLLADPSIPALGASGAISGVVVVFSLLFPKEKILLLGFIPLPAIWGTALAVGLDIWGLVAQTQGSDFPIGFGAHLGGAAVGAVYYFAILRKRFLRY